MDGIPDTTLGNMKAINWNRIYISQITLHENNIMSSQTIIDKTFKLSEKSLWPKWALHKPIKVFNNHNYLMTLLFWWFEGDNM